MIDVSVLLMTLGISLLIQAVFFAFAVRLRTDKVTDLSYSLTFIALAALMLARSDPGLPALVLALMVVAWGLRLAGYLLYRIIRVQKDPRFDGVRERFWKFLQFWLFQGIVVWVIMLPVVIWFADPGPWSPLMTAGLSVWLSGLVIETVADQQKFRHKSESSGRSRWVSSGLWRYSRHPNYFGELLCWWGIFVYVAGDLSGWGWLAVAGPATLTCILLFLTGIPPLEKSAEQKWGDDPRYREYKRKTNVLIPWRPSDSRAAD